MCWGSYHAGLLEGISEGPPGLLGLLGSCGRDEAPSNSPGGGPVRGGFTSPAHNKLQHKYTQTYMYLPNIEQVTNQYSKT